MNPMPVKGRPALGPGKRTTDPDISRGRKVALAQGMFYVTTGLWPLIHMGSFERVLGSKHDHWLVRTVSSLLIANGVAQMATEATPVGVAAARRFGLGTAVSLTFIDLRYSIPGRISRMYLVDVLIESGWILAWARVPRRHRRPERVDADLLRGGLISSARWEKARSVRQNFVDRHR